MNDEEEEDDGRKFHHIDNNCKERSRKVVIFKYK
jgi:hypothetical protein